MARGTVTAVREENGERLADCALTLEHADRGVLLEAEATVVLPRA